MIPLDTLPAQQINEAVELLRMLRYSRGPWNFSPDNPTFRAVRNLAAAGLIDATPDRIFEDVIAYRVEVRRRRCVR